MAIRDSTICNDAAFRIMLGKYRISLVKRKFCFAYIRLQAESSSDGEHPMPPSSDSSALRVWARIHAPHGRKQGDRKAGEIFGREMIMPKEPEIDLDKLDEKIHEELERAE